MREEVVVSNLISQAFPVFPLALEVPVCKRLPEVFLVVGSKFLFQIVQGLNGIFKTGYPVDDIVAGQETRRLFIDKLSQFIKVNEEGTIVYMAPEIHFVLLTYLGQLISVDAVSCHHVGPMRVVMDLVK